jgi:ADP-ribosylglycohydrolase
MILNLESYKSKLLGCWMGKNIGGTLGAPFEFKRQINNVEFYTQELNGDPLPNDDLDIQLLWLVALEEQGIELDSLLLSEYWQLYVTPHWAEYGTAKINMKSGLLPPNCGTENNDFKNSNGSFIRSEIWACISPGCPRIAVRYAYEDAIIDHGNGEGVYAEVFLAALESAAFVHLDIFKLIEIGLSYIPDDCAVSCAIKDAVEYYRIGGGWLEARDGLLKKHRGWGFVVETDDEIIDHVSKEDHKKGLADGKIGWDAPVNMGIIILGLLFGEGDFGKTLCIAVNCGEDTDCTAATLGSIFGILNGIEAIPEKWKDPIGNGIVTACLNLGELGGYGEQLPGTIENLADRVYEITQQVILRNKLPIEISAHKETDLSDLEVGNLFSNRKYMSGFNHANGPVFRFDFYNITVDYCEGPVIKNNTPKKINIILENKYKTQEIINLHWYTPDEWSVFPSTDGKIYVAQTVFAEHKKVVEFTILTEAVTKPENRFVVELTLEGRNTVMLVPIVLLNGNLLTD